MELVAADVDQYLLQARARPQQQTRQPPVLLSIDETEGDTNGQTDGRTLDRFMTLARYYADHLVSDMCKEETNAVRRTFHSLLFVKGWLGSRVVSVLDSGAEGPGFKSQSRRCRVTVLGSELGSSPLKGCEDNCGPGRK